MIVKGGSAATLEILAVLLAEAWSKRATRRMPLESVHHHSTIDMDESFLSWFHPHAQELFKSLGLGKCNQ